MSIEAFTGLCRELDVGAAYQRYLERFFDLANPVAVARLKQQVLASEQSALRVASGQGLIKHDIDRDAHHLISRWVAGEQPLIWNGKAVHCHTLSMMGVELSAIVLICADLENSSTVVPLIACVPDDPEHPVKRYASSAEFVAELTRQLRSPDYQRFFSRFVTGARAR